MIELDKDKIQVKYITGINKTLKEYPTPLDVLYDSCIESVDDCLFSEAKMENKYGISEERINEIIYSLVEQGFIVQKGKKYKIVNSIWH